MKEKSASPKGLKKALGFKSLFLVSIGIVVSQTSVVSIFRGAGLGGGSFFIAIFIAFIIALSYISTYSELALMMRKAGSISTYTAVAMGHFPAIIAAISAYVAPAVFGSVAELFLLQNVVETIFSGEYTYISLLVVWVFTFLNIMGIDLFKTVQSVISFTMLVTLIVIGFVGLGTLNESGISSDQIISEVMHPKSSLFTLVLIALWPFIAFEMVCDFIEEAKNPTKHIPKAMFSACIVLFFAYCLIAFAAMNLVSSQQLIQSEIPHLVLGKVIFGNLGSIVILVLSITTTCGFISTGFATTPRLLYGMANHKQLPPIFMKLHPKYRTPWFGILMLAVVISLAIFLFQKNSDELLVPVISGASCYLLAYIITHLDLMLLRKKYPDYPRTYKSPFFPILQIVGILGMIYAFLHSSPTIALQNEIFFNVGFSICATAIFAFLWVKLKMKRGLLQTESIEDAIQE
jgi:amino acid transporter